MVKGEPESSPARAALNPLDPSEKGEPTMNEIDLDAEPNQSPTVFETQETAVTVVRDHEPSTLSPLDVAPDVFRAGLDRRRINHKALVDWVRAALVQDVDFGKIHVKKKSECDKGKWCQDPSHFS